MEQSDLTTQLGISIEDANFLQQVLSEVGDEIENPIETVVEQANENPILERIITEQDESTSRFSSAIWYDKVRQQSIIFGGLGGIGGYCCFLLSRMHPASMFIYDDDIVEAANLSGQMFTNNDIGLLKVTAVANCMSSYSNYRDVFAMNGRFDATCQAGNIMMCGFDNMQARKDFFCKWREHVHSLDDEADRAKCLFVDGRLAAESFQVFCIKGNDYMAMQKYNDEWLFDDSEAEETVCSYKQTSFCANMIASVMVNCFVNFIANQCNPLIPRDVPFFTEYDASMMFFKTES